MGLNVIFVSGPRRSGKSALIRAMIDRLWKHEPHYLRLVKSGSDKKPPNTNNKPTPQCDIASAQWLEYDPELIFEILPAALAKIHREDRYGSVVIEADADPVLRSAYSYDYRIFVMPVPSKVREIFRDSAHAAEELRRALDDTAAFASEIFGLFADSDIDSPDPHEVRPEMTASHMRGFLYSPLGDELATRIQLQPPYHGLIESDVIVVSEKIGKETTETDQCIRRIEQLLARARGVSGKRSDLFFCDPFDHKGRDCKKLLKILEPICKGGK